MALEDLAFLDARVPIVEKAGQPTPQFMLWFQNFVRDVIEVTGDVAGAVPDSRQVNAGTGLTGGGDLTVDRTISLDTASEAERVRDVIGAALVAGTNITITIDDPGNTITIASSGSGSGGVLPVVTGDVPPVLVYTEDGSLVYMEI